MECFAAHEGSKPTTICKETYESLIKSNQDLSRLKREKKNYWGRASGPHSLQGFPFLWEFHTN